MWGACLLPVMASFDELVEKGDAHDVRFQSDQALAFYLPAEALQPDNAALLVKISRQYALKMNDLADKNAKITAGRMALQYARRAVKADAQFSDAHLSVAICLGKLTPFLGAREKVETSREIKQAADLAVKLDPQSDLAWQVLGRWHQELANIGFAIRTLAKVIYGGLPPASNERAAECFRKAMALNPKRLVHVIELGRTLALMDQDDEARKFLRNGLAMPDRDKDDPETKVRGKVTLDGIS
jgi:tetratricopeptide (TPR) repeat protein